MKKKMAIKISGEGILIAGLIITVADLVHKNRKTATVIQEQVELNIINVLLTDDLNRRIEKLEGNLSVKKEINSIDGTIKFCDQVLERKIITSKKFKRTVIATREEAINRKNVLLNKNEENTKEETQNV